MIYHVDIVIQAHDNVYELPLVDIVMTQPLPDNWFEALAPFYQVRSQCQTHSQTQMRMSKANGLYTSFPVDGELDINPFDKFGKLPMCTIIIMKKNYYNLTNVHCIF